MRKATMFGELIIMIVYLPIPELHRYRGKDVLSHGIYRDRCPVWRNGPLGNLYSCRRGIVFSGRLSEKENILMKWAKKGYTPHPESGYAESGIRCHSERTRCSEWTFSNAHGK